MFDAAAVAVVLQLASPDLTPAALEALLKDGVVRRVGVNRWCVHDTKAAPAPGSTLVRALLA